MHNEPWAAAQGFHGHACPGLAIGVRASEAVERWLGAGHAADEELVCITENDACGVDAIQVLLGCTFGKGNLIYRSTGKHAYTFVNRDSGKAIRLYLQAQNPGLERQAFQDYLLGAPVDELFTCTTVDGAVPERARIFTSITCETCGEAAAEHKIRLQSGQRVCLDCVHEYTRGW